MQLLVFDQSANTEAKLIIEIDKAQVKVNLKVNLNPETKSGILLKFDTIFNLRFFVYAAVPGPTGSNSVRIFNISVLNAEL